MATRPADAVSQGFADVMDDVRKSLEWDMRGWWKVKQKGNTIDVRRFLEPRLVDSTNCTHSLNRPGERCCYCGGTA